MVDPASERVNEDVRAANGAEAVLDDALLALGFRTDGPRLGQRHRVERLRARMAELGLNDEQYGIRLRESAAERAVARRAIAPVNARMWRDNELWRRLAGQVLPAFGAVRPESRLWVADAGAGEEAFTLALLWGDNPATRRRPVRVLATDSRQDLIARARTGQVAASAARGLPANLRSQLLPADGGDLLVAAEARARVVVAEHDLARDPWPFDVDLLLLRNGVLTWWGPALRDAAINRAYDCLVSHGWLAVGRNERLEGAELERFERVDPDIPLYRRRH